MEIVLNLRIDAWHALGGTSSWPETDNSDLIQVMRGYVDIDVIARAQWTSTVNIFQNAPLSWPTVACDLDQPGVKLSGLRDDLLHEGRAAVPRTAVPCPASCTHLTSSCTAICQPRRRDLQSLNFPLSIYF